MKWEQILLSNSFCSKRFSAELALCFTWEKVTTRCLAKSSASSTTNGAQGILFDNNLLKVKSISLRKTRYKSLHFCFINLADWAWEVHEIIHKNTSKWKKMSYNELIGDWFSFLPTHYASIKNIVLMEAFLLRLSTLKSYLPPR